MGLLNDFDLSEEKPKRSEISAACLERILDNSPTTLEPYPLLSLYPSMIYDMTPQDAVLAHWCPEISVEPWKKLMYTSHGNAAEKVIQRGLFRAGVLDCPHSFFQETKVYCPVLGVSGRMDGVAYKERLKALGHSKGPQAYDGDELTRVILELKETSHFQYGKIKSARDLPMKFQWAQTLYQMISGIPETMFVYINRDSMALKTVFFRSTPEMQQEVRDKCELLWAAIHAKAWEDENGDLITLGEFMSERANDDA